jgi:hypothetical protein
MSQFQIHSILTANATAKPLLEGSLKKYGFVPNLHGGLAEAPATLKAYIELTALFDQTSFSPTERQVILLAISVENHLHLLCRRALDDRQTHGQSRSGDCRSPAQW